VSRCLRRRAAATIRPHWKRFEAKRAKFSGEAGQIGNHPGVSCHSIRHPISLRLNAKRGIVPSLDAAGWVRIRDDP
jgi:hypothetical protein